jgi:hypothetical protein
MHWWKLGWLVFPAFLFLPISGARAQNTGAADPSTVSTAALPPLPPPSASEKWNFFLSETFTPFTLVAAVPDAIASQLTRSAPLYGKHFWRREAFLKRFGATLGDDTSQNFFSDFVLASALHEDTRYIREGPSHRFWQRMEYAISRAVVTRTDAGSGIFNWANVGGCAMSAALSNAYYPSNSRTAPVAAVNWGTNVAGTGLTNLMPEFGPDVGRWMKRHLTFHH